MRHPLYPGGGGGVVSNGTPGMLVPYFACPTAPAPPRIVLSKDMIDSTFPAFW